MISYSDSDKLIAEKVVKALRGKNLNCWIAFENLRPSDSWPDMISNAILECEYFLIILTPNSNASKQVIRELTQADELNKKLYCFQTENFQISGGIKYFFSSIHRLEAFKHGFDNALTIMVKDLFEALSPDKDTSKQKTEDSKRENEKKQKDERELKDQKTITEPKKTEQPKEELPVPKPKPTQAPISFSSEKDRYYIENHEKMLLLEYIRDNTLFQLKVNNYKKELYDIEFIKLPSTITQPPPATKPEDRYLITTWYVKAGDYVTKDKVICTIVSNRQTTNIKILRDGYIMYTAPVNSYVQCDCPMLLINDNYLKFVTYHFDTFIEGNSSQISKYSAQNLLEVFSNFFRTFIQTNQIKYGFSKNEEICFIDAQKAVLPSSLYRPLSPSKSTRLSNFPSLPKKKVDETNYLILTNYNILVFNRWSFIGPFVLKHKYFNHKATITGNEVRMTQTTIKSGLFTNKKEEHHSYFSISSNLKASLFSGLYLFLNK